MISKQKIQFGLRISIAIALLGILFKIMHWPFPGFVLVIGVTAIVIFYSLHFYKKQPKTLLEYSKLALLIFFLIYYLLKVLHLPFSYFFKIATLISLVVLITLYIRQVFFLKASDNNNSSHEVKKKSLQKNLSKLLFSLAAVVIIIGAQFKILHWQFEHVNANLFLVIGFLSAIGGVLLDLKGDKS